MTAVISLMTGDSLAQTIAKLILGSWEKAAEENDHAEIKNEIKERTIAN